jgi:osmotically-inducible protein OsmY
MKRRGFSDMSTNRSNMWTIYRAGSVGLLSGCLWFSAAPATFAQDAATPQQGAQPGANTDADIQSNVAYALTHDSSLQGQQIASTTAQGQVTLSGTVQTHAQRQQAETLAANVSGVSGILNNIEVTDGNSPLPTAAAASEQQDTAQAQDQVPPPPPDQAPPAGNQGYSQSAPPPPSNGARPPYQYQQQGGYPPPQQAYNPPPPSGPVTIPSGTLVRVRLSEPLDTAHLANGAFFQATAAADVYQGGALAIPRGAVLTGQVVEAKKGGELGGSATLRLQLTNINLEGRVYPVATDVWSNKGPNKAGYTAGNTIGGAALGAIIGGIVGRGAGAAIGAGVGGAAGLATSAATNGPRLILPTEAQVDFHLTNAVTVQPVSWQEAQRLATASTPQPPRLARRPVAYPYPYGYPPPPPYYGYPY